MTWNYRVIKTRALDGDPFYELREAYYDTDGKLSGYTAGAVGFGGDSVEELKEGLEMALSAFDKPVIEEDVK